MCRSAILCILVLQQIIESAVHSDKVCMHSVTFPRHLSHMNDLHVKMKKQMECMEIWMQPLGQDQDVQDNCRECPVYRAKTWTIPCDSLGLISSSMNVCKIFVCVHVCVCVPVTCAILLNNSNASINFKQ